MGIRLQVISFDFDRIIDIRGGKGFASGDGILERDIFGDFPDDACWDSTVSFILVIWHCPSPKDHGCRPRIARSDVVSEIESTTPNTCCLSHI